MSIHSLPEHPVGDCLSTVAQNTLRGDCLSTVSQNTLRGDCLSTVSRNQGWPHPRQPAQSAPRGQLDQRKFTRSVLEACRAAPQGSKGRSGTLSPSAVGVCSGLRQPPHPWHVEASPRPLASPSHGIRPPWCVSVSTFPPFINNNRTGIRPSQ